MCKQRLEERLEVRVAGNWRTAVPGRGKSKNKGGSACEA